MSLANNPIWSTLDAFDADVQHLDVPEAMTRLVRSLADHRRNAPLESWKAYCGAIGEHPAIVRLLEDPYSRDARTKPAGYAGDARTLDYVYLQHPGAPMPTRRGRAVFDVATSVPIAAAVRERSRALARQIVDCARATRSTSDQRLRVASIACGHARELDHVPQVERARVAYWGLDQDARSVEHCRARFGPSTLAATFDAGSVRDVVTGRTRIPTSDLVYASGLFDYLDERAGALLVKRLFAAVDIGGSVLVPNLTPRNEERGYMEAVMDWWMVYRTESDLRALASRAGCDGPSTRVTTCSTSDGRVAWLRIDRLAPGRRCSS